MGDVLIGISGALPVLGTLALGAQRLLPAFQQTYGSRATIAGNQVPVIETVELLDQPLPRDVMMPPPPPLDLHRDIRFDSIRFRYTEDGPWVLNGLDLVVHKGTRVGIIGGAGSGKSTAMDILMGLLEPVEGEVWVDDISIRGEMMRAWLRSVAHVPQNIYLSDSTIAENIAFGIPRATIDMDCVRLAAREAQIADFIADLPDGYDTVVGERGIRLSGGQRQRLGVELRDGHATVYVSYEEMMRNHPGAVTLSQSQHEDVQA